MTDLVGRAAAGVGWLAHSIGRLIGSIIWFAPRGVPWAILVAALLATGAWRSVEDARVAQANQPRPDPVGLADVVENRATGWVGTSSIVRGPFLDSAAYGASIQRWYYLLTDPADDSVAMIARSTERLEQRRTRTIVARVEQEPSAVARALGALEAGTLEVHPERYLVELADRRPTVLVDDEVVTPDDREVAGDITLRGEFGAGQPTADGEAWEYLVSDGNRAVVVRSPHPPDALPVDVWGVAATDRTRAEQAAAVPELQAALDDRSLPERRLLAEGVTPPFATISHLPAMMLAALAVVILIGWLIGYPLYRRHPFPDRIATWPMQPGDEIPAALFGSDRRGSQRVVVDGSPGRLALLDADEVERRSWQFALRDTVGGGPAAAEDATDSSGILTLSSGEGPILVRLGPGSPDVDMSAGTVFGGGRARPALRLRAADLDVLATFSSAADRDRAVAAIEPWRAESLAGRPPAREAVRRPVPGARLPVPLRVAAVVLAAVGALFMIGGAIGLTAGMAGRSELVPGAGQLMIGIGLAAVARGVWLRRSWADGVGFNVAWIGAAIAAFLVIAAPGCGLWLTPNLVACDAIGPLGSAGALAAAIGLGYAAIVIRRYAPWFVR